MVLLAYPAPPIAILNLNEYVKILLNNLQSFNKLTLQQKKDKLLNDLKVSLAQRVKAGKLTQAQADTQIKAYTDRIAKWDGTGVMPQLGGGGRGFQGKRAQ